MDEKKNLRTVFLKKRNELSFEEVEKKSDRIYRKFINSNDYFHCKELFTYVSMKKEVSTVKIIKKVLEDGKTVAVPKVDAIKREMFFSMIYSLDELETGHFGVLEPKKECVRPVEASQYTLILVPGVVFDLNKNRIGYGGGYYDSYLRKYKDKVMKTIGLAYNFQLIDRIPAQKHDIPLDLIVTDKDWLY